MVPHLITALTGPINELEQRILESLPAIERWFRLEWMEHTPPFYTSVDVRNAGFKLAPVDTNLFPGGFNNLTPEMLHEQYLLPPLHAGWAVRRKTNHFQAYEEVAKKFAKLLGMDSWLINPLFARCGEVNFSDGTGAECLMSNAEALLAKVRRKYKEYGIQEKPFVIVKADAGTYGMGIMTVRDPKDLIDLSRRTRNKMGVIKDGQEVSEVILQEGVPTYERVHDAVAEPVVYMIDRYVVGGFYRVNAERGIDENLNSPG